MARPFSSKETMPNNLMSRRTFEDLPVDSVKCILRKLSIEDLLAVGSTCRTLNAVVNSDDIWLEHCQRWKDELELAEWRAQADSARALYKVLRKFSEMVGVWTARDLAQELAPRGAMLFITWEKFSLVACHVLPHSFDDIKFDRLFDVIGVRDGSVKVELVTASRVEGNMLDVRVPGALVWSSSKSEFHLEKLLDDDIPSTADTSCASASIEGQTVREESNPLPRLGHVEGEDANLIMQLHQSLLLRSVPMGLAYQHVVPIAGNPSAVQQYGSIVGQWANQILMPFTSFENHRPEISGEENIIRGGKRSSIRHSVFRILQIDEARSGKELAGLWSGIYGPHGHEVINVSYKEDEIVATKVLGDPNVPCNQITFRVSIASESTITSAELQQLVAMLPFPDNHSIADTIKVYEGHGRIAGHNFVNPRWVPGQLLVDRNGLISFLWKSVYFIIRFCRMDLPALYRRHKCLSEM